MPMQPRPSSVTDRPWPSVRCLISSHPIADPWRSQGSRTVFVAEKLGFGVFGHAGRQALALRPARRRAGAGGAVPGGRVQAGLQRVQQAGRLRRGGRPGGRAHLAALGLGLDQFLQRLPVPVVVLVRVEVLGHRVDERGRHPQFLGADVDVLVEEREVRGAYLVGPQHRLQHQQAVAAAEHGQRLTLAQRHPGHRDLAGTFQGVPEQHVGPGPGLLGLHVVAAVPQDGIHLVRRAEVQHLDAAGGGQRQLGEILVGQHDHLAVRQLIPLGHVGERDLLAVQRADPAEMDPAAVLGVHLAE